MPRTCRYSELCVIGFRTDDLVNSRLRLHQYAKMILSLVNQYLKLVGLRPKHDQSLI
jgi:hypothetical protein